MGKRCNNILETIGNTPAVRINRLAPPGVNLYVKVEAFNPLGSVKDRLALGVFEDAERTGKLKPGQTVIEATSGNTGIGLAMVCAAKGYPLVVTIAETFSIGRRKLMRFLGAKVTITPAAARGPVDTKAIRQVLRIKKDDALRCSKDLATKEGIFVGISSGATFAGALQVAASASQGSTILCMLPDTGERYLSTPLFADVSTDMTPEEVEIAHSTPGCWL